MQKSGWNLGSTGLPVESHPYSGISRVLETFADEERSVVSSSLFNDHVGMGGDTGIQPALSTSNLFREREL